MLKLFLADENFFRFIHGKSEYVERYLLESGKYGSPELFNWNESVPIALFPAEIILADIFERTISKEL